MWMIWSSVVCWKSEQVIIIIVKFKHHCHCHYTILFSSLGCLLSTTTNYLLETQVKTRLTLNSQSFFMCVGTGLISSWYILVVMFVPITLFINYAPIFFLIYYAYVKAVGERDSLLYLSISIAFQKLEDWVTITIITSTFLGLKVRTCRQILEFFLSP